MIYENILLKAFLNEPEFFFAQLNVLHTVKSPYSSISNNSI